jgi:hypothetical protein
MGKKATFCPLALFDPPEREAARTPSSRRRHGAAIITENEPVCGYRDDIFLLFFDLSRDPMVPGRASDEVTTFSVRLIVLHSLPASSHRSASPCVWYAKRRTLHAYLVRIT